MPEMIPVGEPFGSEPFDASTLLSIDPEPCRRVDELRVSSRVEKLRAELFAAEAAEQNFIIKSREYVTVLLNRSNKSYKGGGILWPVSS